MQVQANEVKQFSKAKEAELRQKGIEAIRALLDRIKNLFNTKERTGDEFKPAGEKPEVEFLDPPPPSKNGDSVPVPQKPIPFNPSRYA